jgi:hypothetical protein
MTVNQNQIEEVGKVLDNDGRDVALIRFTNQDAQN